MEKKKLNLKKVKIAKLSMSENALKNVKGGGDGDFTTVKIITVGGGLSTLSYQATCSINDIGVCTNEGAS